jgi:NarL family two-component system response regulator LiaR
VDQISSPIRVLIVDDQVTMRTGLKYFILAFADFELAGEAADGDQALILCDEVKPDVVLMDLDMPGLDGLGATQSIRRHWPQIKVIVLTSFREKETVQKVSQVGATNYLNKNISADNLADAIRAAHSAPQ